MKVVVTGGAGFIGANLVRHLLRATPHEVLNLDKLTYAGNLASLRDVEECPRYHFEQVDICDAGAVQEVFREFCPDAVIHLAAESHVDRSIDEPGVFMKTNVLGTFHLLQAARDCWGEGSPGNRFVHVSTDEVFGSLSLEAPPFSECTPYDPRSPYSASKAASDHLARSWFCTYGLPVVVTNCSNNYGPYQFPEKLIPLVILKCLRDEEIPVYGSGENIRDWLHVEDHCRALVRVLEDGEPGETYLIGGDNEWKNVDLVRALCGLLDQLHPRAGGAGYSDLISFVSDRPGHDLRYAIDSSRISSRLGWSPIEEFESGLAGTVAWYLENRDWWENILNGGYRLERRGAVARHRRA